MATFSSASLSAYRAAQARTKGNADSGAVGGSSGKTALVVGPRQKSRFGRRK